MASDVVQTWPQYLYVPACASEGMGQSEEYDCVPPAAKPAADVEPTQPEPFTQNLTMASEGNAGEPVFSTSALKVELCPHCAPFTSERDITWAVGANKLPQVTEKASPLLQGEMTPDVVKTRAQYLYVPACASEGMGQS